MCVNNHDSDDGGWTQWSWRFWFSVSVNLWSWGFNVRAGLRVSLLWGGESSAFFFFPCLPNFVVKFVGWVGKYPRELTDGSCFSWDSNMHVEGFLSTLSLGELWYVVYLGINCIDFAEGYEEERGLCHDSVMDVSLGPPGLHSQSYCNGFQWPWASQQKPGSTLKSECVKMAFPTQQIWALCALQVTSADFSDKNKFLWLSCSVSTSETREQESWILCLLVGLITVNPSQQWGCTGTTWPCPAFLLMPAGGYMEERNPSWFSWLNFNCSGHLLGLQLEEEEICSSITLLHSK